MQGDNRPQRRAYYSGDRLRQAAPSRQTVHFDTPTQPETQPMHQPADTAKLDNPQIASKRSTNFKIITLVASGIIITLGLVAGGLIWRQHIVDARNPIPKAARKGLTFQLYYPTKLPEGYSVKEDSFENKDGSLIFYIISPDNKEIGVSEQPLPAGVTLPQSSNGPIKVPGEADFVSAIGHAHISIEGKNYVSETITQGGVWIIINVNGLTLTDATALTQSLTPVR